MFSSERYLFGRIIEKKKIWKILEKNILGKMSFDEMTVTLTLHESIVA